MLCRTTIGPPLNRRPSPFEAIMREMSDWLAIPGDDEIECGFVADNMRPDDTGEISRRALLRVPLVFPREGPNAAAASCGLPYSSTRRVAMASRMASSIEAACSLRKRKASRSAGGLTTRLPGIRPVHH